jgi:hypothetical protein
MAEDIVRPVCKCHGEPMTRNSYHPDGSQKWCCASKRRQRSRDDYWERGQRERKLTRYQERKREGVCANCAGALLSDALCWKCLNDREARYALSL